MSYLIFHNDNINFFTIQLREDPFVEKWANHLQYILDNYNCRLYKSKYPRYEKLEENEIKQHVDNLHTAIRNLNNLGTCFPLLRIDIPYIRFLTLDLDTQKILNKLHRYFTTANCSLNDIGDQVTYSYKDNNYFTIDYTKKEEFRKLIQDINQIVHNLDNSILLPRVRDAIDNDELIEQVTIMFDLYGTREHSLLPNTFKFMDKEDESSIIDNDEYDVWMGVDLLGKDYITGYYNHDDPTEWDIKTLNCYTGKMEIILGSNTIPKIIKGDKFQNWLKEYGMTYIPAMCGIPLGKVISAKDLLNDKTLQQQMSVFNIKIEE